MPTLWRHISALSLAGVLPAATADMPKVKEDCTEVVSTSSQDNECHKVAGSRFSKREKSKRCKCKGGYVIADQSGAPCPTRERGCISASKFDPDFFSIPVGVPFRCMAPLSREVLAASWEVKQLPLKEGGAEAFLPSLAEAAAATAAVAKKLGLMKSKVSMLKNRLQNIMNMQSEDPRADKEDEIRKGHKLICDTHRKKLTSATGLAKNEGVMLCDVVNDVVRMVHLTSGKFLKQLVKKLDNLKDAVDPKGGAEDEAAKPAVTAFLAKLGAALQDIWTLQALHHRLSKAQEAFASTSDNFGEADVADSDDQW